mmetsp:Transcript_30058/g.42255  ORF Transcript_30058/g.42255 Transcript_30058/m.42255 type:complete len:1053 (-) Transcript_30058:74-3232(-)
MEYSNNNNNDHELTMRLSISPHDEHKRLDDPVFLRPSLDVPRIYQEQKQRESIQLHANARKGSKSESTSEKDKKKIDDHRLSLQELCARYQTDFDFENPKESKGLTGSEASKRLTQYGLNQLTPAKQIPWFVKLLKEFAGFFPILLEAGGTLCIIAWFLDDSTNDNLYLGVILWLVVIITALFSFSQQQKSANIMEGFKKLAPQFCKVVRDGQMSEISAVTLVPGDVIFVKAGDKIPADIRIIWSNELKVDNSSLTGESEPQARSEECTDENYLETHNLAFFTTLANEGEAVGVVVRTGDTTVIGNIAAMASTTSADETPLHKEIARFIKIVSVVAISLGLIFLIIGFVVGLKPIPNIVFVIGIIVANVPEGLLPTVTVALTLTAKRLAAKNVLVKNLEAVETLGSTSTICSDKTGTLTENKMTVVHLYYDNKIYTTDEVPTEGTFKKDSPSFKALDRIGRLCSRAVFDSDSENMAKELKFRKVVGDASEAAILRFCEELHGVAEYRLANPKVFEIPFNSVNKWQLSIHEYTEKEEDFDGFLLVMKGAPERVIARCDKILIDGQVHKLTEEHKAQFEHSYEILAGHGERVLGFAHAYLDSENYPKKTEFNEDKKNFPTDGLVFVGLMALMDPPRSTVPDAVQKCKDAGIRIIMVTGDHPLTAVSIAKQIGIINQNSTVDNVDRLREQITAGHLANDHAIAIKGTDIDGLNEVEWDSILQRRQIVFARTSPEQKLQIVDNCQRRGEIVAVTGDGVNDSPALKKADLGCAMGITGSDVSKEAADIILLDDNFASIVNGVEEGRIIFDNLKKSICYTLSSNSAELVPFIVFVIFQIPLALSAVLILCIDLGTDMVPAISLAYERPESDIMRRPPRKSTDRLVTLKLAVYSYLWLGTIQAIAGFMGFFAVMYAYGFSPSDVTWVALDYFKSGAKDYHGYSDSEQVDILKEAQTAFFVSVVVTRISCVLACKTRKLGLLKQGFSNWVFNGGLVVEIVLAVLIAYVPFIEVVFLTKSVSWYVWMLALPFFCFNLITDEIRKLFIRKNPHGWLKRYTMW